MIELCMALLCVLFVLWVLGLVFAVWKAVMKYLFIPWD